MVPPDRPSCRLIAPCCLIAPRAEQEKRCRCIVVCEGIRVAALSGMCRVKKEFSRAVSPMLFGRSCLAGQYTWAEAATLTRQIRLQIIV